MTKNDSNIKIFTFENNDFVEIPETYYSTDSKDITFIKNNQFFKIEIPDNFFEVVSRKRKVCDCIYIDNDESLEKIQILQENITVAEKQINELKNKLLQSRLEIERNVAEKTRAINICNQLREKIIKYDINKNQK